MESLSAVDLNIPEDVFTVKHPWDELVETMFGKDYEFPTFDAVVIPEGFNLTDAIPHVEHIGNKLQQNVFDSLSSTELSDIHVLYKAPFINSEGQYDEQQHKNYVELLQMITNLPEDAFNDQIVANELSKKMVHRYVQIFKD